VFTPSDEIPVNTFPIFQLGGGIARTAEHETAVGGRAVRHTFNVNATVPSEGFDEERELSRALWWALEPHPRAST
jgi:hypothetical protein